MISYIKKRFILSISFLIIGVITYLLFDMNFLTKSNTLFSIIRDFAPDICWTLSFFFLSIYFTSKLTKNDLIINSLYVFSIAILYELLQCYHIVKGTFDIVDIFIYIISIIIACLVEQYIRRKEKEKR